MPSLRSLGFLCLVLIGGSLLAQEPQPAHPFQAVHLLWVDVQQPHAEERVRAAIAGLNDAITQAGCPACVYHLWRVTEAPQGSYNYVQVSNWPSSTVYNKVHNSPEYVASSKAWVQLRSVVTREAYEHEIEIPVGGDVGSMAHIFSQQTGAPSSVPLFAGRFIR